MPRRRAACPMRDRTCVRSGPWKAGRESPSGEIILPEMAESY